MRLRHEITFSLSFNILCVQRCCVGVCFEYWIYVPCRWTPTIFLLLQIRKNHFLVWTLVTASCVCDCECVWELFSHEHQTLTTWAVTEKSATRAYAVCVSCFIEWRECSDKRDITLCYLSRCQINITRAYYCYYDSSPLVSCLHVPIFNSEVHRCLLSSLPSLALINNSSRCVYRVRCTRDKYR